MTPKRPGHTVRPGSSWGSRKVLYVAVFAATCLVVYWWRLAPAQPSKPARTYTSTATVHLQGESKAAADPEKIRRQIASKTNLHRAVRQLESAINPPPNQDRRATASRAVEAVRRNLRVTADGISVPGTLAISITYTDQVAGYPARLVNSLAQSYADDYRAEWKKRTYGAYAEARGASKRAEREFLQAKARLDAFCRRHFEAAEATQPDNATGPAQQPADNGQAVSPEASELDSKTPASATGSEPPLVDNPDWLELSKQLAALKQHWETLLADRTRVHPEVLDTELRIAALEQQLSATPMKIPRTIPGANPLVASPPDVAPGQPAPDRAETARRFQTLKEAADLAAEACFQAVQLERQAWQEHQQEPRIELDLAEPIQAPAQPGHRLAMVLTSLAAGLAVAVGVGMVSAGAAIQPTLTTVEQVRGLLPVPVVGTVPETCPASEAKPSRRWRPLGRLILIVAGLILIAGCVGMLLVPLGG